MFTILATALAAPSGEQALSAVKCLENCSEDSTLVFTAELTTSGVRFHYIDAYPVASDAKKAAKATLSGKGSKWAAFGAYKKFSAKGYRWMPRFAIRPDGEPLGISGFTGEWPDVPEDAELIDTTATAIEGKEGSK